MSRPVKGFIQWFIISTLGLVFYFGHGLRFELTPWAQALVNVMTNFEYGPAGRIDTTVLLVTEADLQKYNWPYPVPYDVHADVLESLLNQSPRAVFIDFAFIDPHSEADMTVLHDAICKLNPIKVNANGKPNIPVFVIAPFGLAGGPVHNQAMLECATKVGAKVNSDEGLSGVLTYCAWMLPMLPESRPGEAEDEPDPCTTRSPNAVPSAAYALWNSRGRNSAPLPDEMQLVWPIGSDPQNKKFLCGKDPSIWHVIAEIYKHGPHVVKRNCPYSRTMLVSHLLQNPEDEDVHTSLLGRTVFYGAAFALGGDVVKSPVFVDLPGVYLHATAYDNLVTYDGHVKRRAEGAAKCMTVGLLLLGAAILVWWHARHRPGDKSAETHPRRSMLALYFFSLPVWVGLGLWARSRVPDIVQPEHLLFVLLVLYIVYRVLTHRLMAAISIFVYLYTCVMFLFFDIALRSFLEIILFFEIGDYLLETLHGEAEKNDLEKRAGINYTLGVFGRVYSCFLKIFSNSEETSNGHSKILN